MNNLAMLWEAGKSFKETSKTLLFSGNIKFTKNLYSILSKKEEGNVLFSPFSLECALILICYGAHGNTEKEIIEALQLLPVWTSLGALLDFKNVLDSLNESKFNFLIANGLFIDKNFTIRQRLNFILKKNNYDFVKNLDFDNKNESIDVINKFVEKETHKKIVNALNQEAIEDVTKAFLVNIVYFKGFWENQFDPSYTEEGDFYINLKEIVKVDFMWTKGDFMYSNNFEYHVVKLPYEGNQEEGSKCCMILIVPIKINGLKTIEDQIKELDLIDLIEKCSDKKRVSLQLPKFEFNEAMPNVREVLNELQIRDFFDPSRANLRNITDDSGLYVDGFVHKCYLKVSEKGTEGAAMPKGGSSKEVVPQEIPIHVKADHPFLFFIYDSQTKMILFFGRVKKF